MNRKEFFKALYPKSILENKKNNIFDVEKNKCCDYSLNDKNVYFLTIEPMGDFFAFAVYKNFEHLNETCCYYPSYIFVVKMSAKFEYQEYEDQGYEYFSSGENEDFFYSFFNDDGYIPNITEEKNFPYILTEDLEKNKKTFLNILTRELPNNRVIDVSDEELEEINEGKDPNYSYIHYREKAYKITRKEKNGKTNFSVENTDQISNNDECAWYFDVKMCNFPNEKIKELLLERFLQALPISVKN